MNPSAATERDRVGPYQLVKAIGAGGSARVDLARIERAYGFQRHVVIKRPLEHLRADARASESLRREARLGARLRHPNLVAVLDTGVQDGYDYIVLEYVQGASLRALMEANEPARVRDLPLEVALAIVRDVARALHQAHELTDDSGAPLGLVHRDVSPGNVLVGLDGAVKLADFGIAKETRVVTLSGSMHGTVTYMTPEQCRGHAFDRRADIFSLGVILYELVTGTRLFWADNDVASLHRVLAGHVPKPRRVKHTIHARLEEIILTALAHDPVRRFTTARAFADELEAYGAGSGLVICARHISRWATELLGPRDVPWIGASTVVDAEPVFEEGLVELIAQAPQEAPPALTFGPSDGAFEDPDIDTEPSRSPPRTARKWTLAVVGVGLIAGSAVTAALMLRQPEPSTPAPIVPPPAAVPATRVEPPPPPARAEPTAVLPAPEPTIVDNEPKATSKKKATRAHKHQQAAAAPPPAPPPPAPGSAAAPPPKVEWDPKMLLPTDKRK